MPLILEALNGVSPEVTKARVVKMFLCMASVHFSTGELHTSRSKLISERSFSLSFGTNDYSMFNWSEFLLFTFLQKSKSIATLPHLLKFGVLLFHLHQILNPLLVVLMAYKFSVLFWQVVHLCAEKIHFLWDPGELWNWVLIFSTKYKQTLSSYIEELLLFVLLQAQLSQLQTAVSQLTGQLLDRGLRLGEHGLLGLQPSQHQ